MPKLRIAGLVALGAATLLILNAARFSQLVETVYARSLYRWLISPLSRFTGIFPFSVAEVLAIALGIWLLYKLVRAAISLYRARRLNWYALGRQLTRLGVGALVVYVVFNLMWGLNYHRSSFAELSGLPVEPASTEELAVLAEELVHMANALREQVTEDEQGVMTLSTDIRGMFNRAQAGFDNAAKLYPELGGNFGRPKGVYFSRFLSLSGISGIYIPFTGEANVNIDIPHMLLPATTIHEMAHQRGFAREDEANYIGWLASRLHPDPDFQYSGTMLAMIHTMRALYQHDPERNMEIRELYSPGVARDLRDWSAYWAQFEGPVERVSTRMNDTYLRANRQSDGVQSYGRMVDLLLAEFRGQGDRSLVRD
ncbi:MAG: DUF3810 domain-containing protein [Firmicutes bacterium]|nr:DUF3810 domain-containing protein [Bacillota bacterium]